MIIIKPFHHLGLCPWLLLGELLSGAEAMAYGSWLVKMIMVEIMVKMTVLIMVRWRWSMVETMVLLRTILVEMMVVIMT